MVIPSFYRRRRNASRRCRRTTTTRRGKCNKLARSPVLVPLDSAAPSRAAVSSKRPREFKSLLVESFNCEGLTALSREEILEKMCSNGIDLMILQELWTEIPSERTESPNGFLFLLHGDPRPPGKLGRNSCGISFVLSPSARIAWDEAGADFTIHRTHDNRARLASIRLSVLEKSGKTVDFFVLSAYLPDSSYEATHPFATILDDLGKASSCKKNNDLLIIGIDANCQIGNASSFAGQNEHGSRI